MTKYLFLKFALNTTNSPRQRDLVTAGIDVRLLPLLSARYV